MNFSFSRSDFLNYFSSGFFLVFGISILNCEYASKILSSSRDSIGDRFILVSLIVIVIIILGIIIYGFSSLLSDLSQSLNRRRKKRSSRNLGENFFLEILYFLSFWLFGRWSVVGTFIRLKDERELPDKISHIETYNELAILEGKILERSKCFSRINFLSSQFCQTSANSILLVFLTNILLAIFQRGNSQLVFIVLVAIICFFLFVSLKLLSSVFARWHFLNIARKAEALELLPFPKLMKV